MLYITPQMQDECSHKEQAMKLVTPVMSWPLVLGVAVHALKNHTHHIMNHDMMQNDFKKQLQIT